LRFDGGEEYRLEARMSLEKEGVSIERKARMVLVMHEGMDGVRMEREAWIA
jgi:hypothetical protein